MITPDEARTAALHRLSHTSNGWDGYSIDDAAEIATDVMVAFLTGELTIERDLHPLCDSWCF